MNRILALKKNYLVVGRGASGIYLILKCNGIKKAKVLYPANICYAAVYPTIYTDNTPVFCDVDRNSGNITLDTVKKAFGDNGKIKALVAPHMYGNPISDISDIRQFCVKNKILLIEDCASAMGAEVQNIPVGTFGDYVIYSTGYSKTIDLGYGGIIMSDYNMDELATENEKLSAYSDEIEAGETSFSKLYRSLRNDTNEDSKIEIYQSLINNAKPLFLYRARPDLEDRIKMEMRNLDHVIKKRRRNCKLYDYLISSCDYLERYDYHLGAVPWRYNLFVDKEYHRMFIDYLLQNGVPVSDWYPVVAPMVGNYERFKNASNMEERIVNFPLLIEDEQIRTICDIINRFRFN